MTPDEIAQGATVQAKQDFSAVIDRRRVYVTKGQRFWITSTRTYAKTYGVVSVAREGKGHIGTGYPFTMENFNACFEPAKESVTK